MTGPNHHDAFVKKVFSDPENLGGELRTLLPPALLAKLDLATIRTEPGSFVDERLKERHTDLLFSVKLTGRDALLYVLFEHRSSVDPVLVVRLLVYMSRIWDDWLRKHEGARAVPPILPLVLYQGPTAWNAATSLHDAIDVETDALALLREHLPAYRFVLDDLAVQSDEELRARTMAVQGRVALLLLRHIREARSDVKALTNLIVRLGDLLRSIPFRVDRLVVIAYILNVADADRADVESALADALPDLREDVVTVADQIRQKGLEEGLQEGLLRGERLMFLRILRGRFGDKVTSHIEGQVNAADKPTLDLWTDRFAKASTLDDVFSKKA